MATQPAAGNRESLYNNTNTSASTSESASASEPAKIEFEKIAGNFMVAICINATDEDDDSFYVSVLGGYHWKISGFTLGLTAADWDALLAGTHETKDLNIGGSTDIKGGMYGNVSVKKATRSGGASSFRKPKAE